MSEFELNAEEWPLLTQAERIRRCRAFADQARRLSADAAPDLRKSYLELARHWLALAEEIERYGSSI